MPLNPKTKYRKKLLGKILSAILTTGIGAPALSEEKPERSETSDENKFPLELRAEYGWRDFRDKKGEKRDYSELEEKEVTMRSHRLGINARASMDYIRFVLSGGIQKVYVDYRDPQYRYFFRDLKLEFEGDMTPYLAFGAEIEIPIGENFGAGFFGYRETTPKTDMKPNKIHAMLADERYTPGDVEQFGHDAVYSVSYRTEKDDFGLLAAFRSRYFDMEFFAAYSWMLFEMNIDYSQFGERLIESSEAEGTEIREGFFRNYLDGFYLFSRPTLKFGRLTLGADVGIIRLNGSSAYNLGGFAGTRFGKL